MIEKSWYIDAWCPADGLAFASRRRGEILHEESIEIPLMAEETVYLSPPFFEPEQIGSLATALAATRGHFQTGFYQEGNKEIPFESLADVVETVKRVYRGAGGNNLPGTSQPLPISPTDGTENLDELLVNQEFKTAWSDLKNQFNRSRNDDSVNLQHALREFLRVGKCQNTFAKLGLLSVIPLLKRLASDTSSNPADVDALGSWITLLSRAGLGILLDFKKLRVAVFQKREIGVELEGFTEIVPMLDRLEPRLKLIQVAGLSDLGRLIELDPTNIMDTLHRVPIPLDWPSPFPKAPNFRYHFVPTFGALLCLTNASHTFLQKLSSPLHFVPILLATMVLNTGWSNRTKFAEGLDQLEDITCYWLSNSLPSFSLGYAVDDPIYQYSVSILEARRDDMSKIG